jgi:uncharacterized membrane protein YhaH (DUF805 family)
MNFSAAIYSGFRKSFDFRDRASRSEYWYWLIFVNSLDGLSRALDRALDWHGWGLGDLLSLAILVPYVAITFRRLHDINRSGWWALVFWISWIGPHVWIETPGADGIHRTGWIHWASIIVITAFVLGYVFLIVVGVIAGTDGPNRFGPDPYANQVSEQNADDARPVTRVKNNDGYFKKCVACGKFTRGAKVCRHCGGALTSSAVDAPF